MLQYRRRGIIKARPEQALQKWEKGRSAKAAVKQLPSAENRITQCLRGVKEFWTQIYATITCKYFFQGFRLQHYQLVWALQDLVKLKDRSYVSLVVKTVKERLSTMIRYLSMQLSHVQSFWCQDDLRKGSHFFPWRAEQKLWRLTAVMSLFPCTLFLVSGMWDKKKFHFLGTTWVYPSIHVLQQDGLQIIASNGMGSERDICY